MALFGPGRYRYQQFHIQHLLHGDARAEIPARLEELGREFDRKSLVEQQQITEVIVKYVSIHDQCKEFSGRVDTCGEEAARCPKYASPSTMILIHKRYLGSVKAWLPYVEELDRGLEVLTALHERQGSSEFSRESVRIKRIRSSDNLKWARFMIPELQARIDRWAARPNGNVNKILRPRPVDAEGLRKGRKERVMRDPLEHDPPLVFPQDGWVCANPLGGGMAYAALWVNVDDYGNVQARVVRKDTYIESSRGWADATRFVGDPKDENAVVPSEYHCQAKLQARAEATNIVKALKYEVDIANQHYRLYSEYCPHGDLDALLGPIWKSGKIIPEAFIWMVFSKLVDCGLIMERGGINDVAGADWKQIVHRDLKPGNVFLDLSLPHDYPQYPQPKLADFGLAIETSKDDKLNPTVLTGAGTAGFLAPEQQAYIDKVTGEPVDAFQILAHTNVWGVGAIIYTLMHLGGTEPHKQPQYLPNHNEKYLMDPDLQKVYTASLAYDVGQCLKFNPAERPTFAGLRARMDEIMKIWQKPKALHFLPTEKYQLGMAFQPLQSKAGNKGSVEVGARRPEDSDEYFDEG